MSVIARAAEAGWNNAGDDVSLVGAIRAVREVEPGASLTVITPNADRVGAFVGEGVTCVESPLRSIEEVAGRSRGLLGKRQTARSAERMLEAALSGGPDVPEPVRETVSALADADLLVFAGGGYLDDRRPVAGRTASFLGQAARRRGLPYVVFGNAVGPFEESGPR